MRKRRIMMALAAVTVSGLAYRVWDWQREPDLSTAEPPFNSISLPLTSVNGDIYMDGGSVRVDVVDAKGVEYGFMFPIDNMTRTYPKAYHGRETPGTAGGTLLADTERAKKIALYWLKWHAAEDEGRESALSCLSGWEHSRLNAVRHYGLKALFK